MVGCTTSFRRSIFQDHVFSPGRISTLADAALLHFHESADAVGLVDDEIARVERERVDAVAFTPWPAAPIAISSDAVAGEIGFSDDEQGAGRSRGCGVVAVRRLGVIDMWDN